MYRQWINLGVLEPERGLRVTLKMYVISFIYQHPFYLQMPNAKCPRCSRARCHSWPCTISTTIFINTRQKQPPFAIRQNVKWYHRKINLGFPPDYAVYVCLQPLSCTVRSCLHDNLWPVSFQVGTIKC